MSHIKTLGALDWHITNWNNIKQQEKQSLLLLEQKFLNWKIIGLNLVLQVKAPWQIFFIEPLHQNKFILHQSGWFRPCFSKCSVLQPFALITVHWDRSLSPFLGPFHVWVYGFWSASLIRGDWSSIEPWKKGNKNIRLEISNKYWYVQFI